MNVKRILMLGVVGAALVAWFAAASTTGNRRVVQSVAPNIAVVELRGAELAAEIARLRERLRPNAAPQSPARNLFEFSRRAPARIVAPAPPISIVSEPPQAAPAPPQLKLVGIAEDPGPDGAVRTAIISAFGQLFIVKIGEPVTLRYQVAKISSEAAQLTDLGDNSTLTLILK